MRRHRQHALPTASRAVHQVALDFQVQLVDRRFQKCGGQQHAADHVRAMSVADIIVDAGARMVFLQPAGEVSHVSRGEEVVRVQTRGHMFDCAPSIPWLRPDVDRSVARQ